MGNLRSGAGSAAGTGDTSSSARSGSFVYEALEAIPGSERTGEISPYLQAIYRFALWAVGIAALFMLSIGGMMYLTSAGNTSAISTAKKVIFDALIGLVLAIVAWLVLYVINPQLVEANLDIFTSNAHYTNDSGYQGGTANDGSHITTNPTHTSEAATLAQGLLSHASTVGDCASTDGIVSPRKNLEEIIAQESMTTCHNGCNISTSLCNRTTNVNINLLKGLNGITSTFTINSIAGGSHSGASTHYAGNAVDLKKGAVDAFVTGSGTKVGKTSWGGGHDIYKVTANDVTLYYVNESNHWHVQTSQPSMQ